MSLLLKKKLQYHGIDDMWCGKQVGEIVGLLSQRKLCNADTCLAT